ncbi:Gag-Pro-Pol polyprotein [Nosema granulosis]|uniref:Gag-Pro-Pol polyprotein n=1 Tax=Nosema granulosis TaxID=83296 RepID=A0A9P6GYE0_9MICR|nr:Gag-Pro-Pol polyprotein [Nosema granulosis]
MDLFGPIDLHNFKDSHQEGKRMLLVVTDIYSRWSEIFILTKTTSKQIARILETKWFNTYGKPKSILTDQGRQFTSQNFKTFLSQNGIKHATSSAYNPTGNSIVERINQVIGNALRCYRDISLKDAVKKIVRALRFFIPPNSWTLPI